MTSAWDRVKKATKGVLVDPVVDLAQGKVGKSFSDAWQNSPGGQITNGLGDAGGKISAAWKNMQGKKHASHTAEKAAEEMKQNEDTQYGQNKDYASQMGSTDDAYLGSMQGNVNKYQGDLDKLGTEIQGSQTDAKNTYTNQTQPRLKNLMESAQKNSNAAMSLQDAMDPNNKIAMQTRQLYDRQGQQQRDAYNKEAGNTQNSYNDEAQRSLDAYNKQGAGVQQQYQTQAQGEGKQGLADTGVLSAMGMQNMAGQMGNVPMTGGQLQALMGANQAQAGSAYAQTQRRVQSLKDQGLQGNIALQNQGLGTSTAQRGQGLDTATAQRGTGLSRQSDLGTHGLQQGFNRSDTAYNQGQQAVDRYGQAVGNYESASDRQLGRDADFRNQRGDNSNKTYGLQQQMADTTRGVGNAKTARDMSIYNTHMGGKQAGLGADIAGINAKEAQQGQMVTGGLQTAGTVVGSIYGGPAGGAAGGAAGNAAGNAMAPTPNSTPQYGNYNQNNDQVGPPVSASNGYNAAPQDGGGQSYAGSSPGSQGANQGLNLADNGSFQGSRRMPVRNDSKGGGSFRANPHAYADDPKKRGNGRSARA